ncbi:hypothetical protein Bra471DRAFT_03005 [Bradyrhizobium sp. WSM471]|nr:hypothetical protein Bra471DRAFT_03005 [Bradyrhizobium sp. WSM471]
MSSYIPDFIRQMGSIVRRGVRAGRIDARGLLRRVGIA